MDQSQKMTQDVYEVFAIRYATRNAKRTNHFIGGDPHDVPMPMDYYVWLIRNHERTIVVDTGFGPEVAAKRGRTFYGSLARVWLFLASMRTLSKTS